VSTLPYYTWRRQALARANNRCEACGRDNDAERQERGRGLHVHHIRRKTDGGRETPENAKVLCRSCHVAEDPDFRQPGRWPELAALTQSAPPRGEGEPQP
jgi:5-methylcytosine-specific restriction endonuclease McrA